MSGQALLRNLVQIPDEVRAGDFVLGLAEASGRSPRSPATWSPTLGPSFDKALGLIKSAVETGGSKAAYLDGSFGSGKSHFMAVLYAILDGDPGERGKKGVADFLGDAGAAAAVFTRSPTCPALPNAAHAGEKKALVGIWNAEDRDRIRKAVTAFARR